MKHPVVTVEPSPADVAPERLYGGAYEAFRSRLPAGVHPVAVEPTVLPPPRPREVKVAAPRDHTRFGKQFEYHGHVAVTVEEAQRVLSTPVDSGDAFDPQRASSLITSLAQRVAQWRPSRNDVPVYAAQTRNLAAEVTNLSRVDRNGVASPDFFVFEGGKARYVRPQVARLLTAVRDDLKASVALRDAAHVEYQRAAAKAALSAP